MRGWWKALAFTALGLGAAPEFAHADLRLCNYTGSRVGVAIGYKDSKGWVSEGWWTVEPDTNTNAAKPDLKNCPRLIKGPLNARYYYVYAIDFQKGGSWGGKSMFCVRDKLFTIRGINDCLGRNYKQAGFYEVDTGEERDWTISLSGEKTSPPPAEMQPQQQQTGTPQQLPEPPPQ